MSLPRPLPSVDAWTRARDRYTEDLSGQERDLYNKATIDNIFYDASAAEKTHRANSSTRRFATQRLGPLLDAIAEYGKAIDVYANTSPLVLCPLWGSIRVVLHVGFSCSLTPRSLFAGSCRQCAYVSKTHHSSVYIY